MKFFSANKQPEVPSPLITAAIGTIEKSGLPHREQALMLFELLALENRRRELEIPGELIKYGLNGTLAGAIGSLVLLLSMATMSVCSSKETITGTHLCILAGVLCTTVVFYGAFVFDRSVNVAAAWKDGFRANAVKPPPAGEANR